MTEAKAGEESTRDFNTQSQIPLRSMAAGPLMQGGFFLIEDTSSRLRKPSVEEDRRLQPAGTYIW
jgi:hypothetical protein